MIKLIGVSGFARSGKDTFVKYAQKILKENKRMAPRIAFADSLKKNLDSWLRQYMGISAWTRDDNEKKIIRPMLVGYGEGMRQLNENHWVEEIRDNVVGAMSNKVDFEGSSDFIFPLISDVRYMNEVNFVKELGGAVVVVEREGIAAPNKSEELIQPEVNKVADYIIKWPTFGEGELDKAEEYVRECLKTLGVI